MDDHFDYAFKLSFVLAALIIILLLGCPTSCALVKCTGGLQPNYSTGSRVGIIQKFSNKGVVYKSDEGVLLMQGFYTTSGEHPTIVNNTFDFSCVDPTVAEQISKAMTENKVVRLYYNQYLMSPWSIDTEYVIYKVEVLP